MGIQHQDVISMKTNSARIKGTDYGTKPQMGKAYAWLAVGIISLAGAGIIFYTLIMAFMVYKVTDISPYIYYSIAFGATMFLALVSFYKYDKNNG